MIQADHTAKVLGTLQLDNVPIVCAEKQSKAIDVLIQVVLQEKFAIEGDLPTHIDATDGQLCKDAILTSAELWCMGGGVHQQITSKEHIRLA